MKAQPLIDILIPTLGRQQVLLPLMDSIRRTTPISRYRVVFIADENDAATHGVLTSVLAGLDVREVIFNGTFPEKVNAAVRATDAPMILVCGNDVLFHPNWFECAVSRRGVGVVGTNDLTPRTRMRNHATAQVLDRTYIEKQGGAWREPGNAFHEGYYHNYADNELCSVAQFRDEWVFLHDCVIEHRHPVWGTAEMDETYEKGQAHFQDDKQLFRKRRRLWMSSQS